MAPVPRVGPVYRSREQVWEVDPRTGHRVLKYGIGAEIPLAEAMRQGVVTEAQLTAEQRRQLAAHGLPARPPAAAVEEAAREGTEGGGAVSATVKAPKRPKADKMVRDAQTVQK
ncbi:MAG: hypothetical protein QN174_07735 [Armatimonadota bacterium]|nr:hypothetical protein [Armatimonadota bacterium]